MESTVSTTTIFALSETLNFSSKPLIYCLRRHFSISPLSQSLQTSLSSGRRRCIGYGDFHMSSQFSSIYYPATSLWNSYTVAPISSRLASVSSSAAAFASGGGGDGFKDGNSGGSGDGDGGSNGGEAESKYILGESDEVSVLSPDVIILDVEGMTCGGCAATVKRILESQPQVSAASVNFAAETAIVWPVPEAKATPNWQEQLGETLAKHLTNCGFKSNLHGQQATEGDIPK